MTIPNIRFNADQIVNKVLKELVDSPKIPLNSSQGESIQGTITNEITKVVMNQTNQEPWYQSRVTIGAFVSILMPILGLIGVSADIIDSNQLTSILLAMGTVVGGIITLWGRWVAKKPIGE